MLLVARASMLQRPVLLGKDAFSALLYKLYAGIRWGSDATRPSSPGREKVRGGAFQSTRL